MQLLSLRLENFGLFRGVHSFDLIRRSRSQEQRNLTLFVGHNGAGKSTLFRALSLALHGSLALGDKITQAQYNDFLYSRLHRHPEGEKMVVSTQAAVSLSFEYVQSGVSRRVQVARRWPRNGRIVAEHLEVMQDGRLLVMEQAEAQTWINDVFPPGVARLCFFDAEDLDSLASVDSQNPHLGQALQRLLGIDIIQRLQTDLRSYTLRQGGSSMANDWRKKVLTHQAAMEGLDRKLKGLQERAAQIEEEETEHQARLAEQERQLAAAGGLYAARRTMQQERLEIIRQRVQSAQEQMRELAAQLLPFALAPALSRRLSARLTEEAERQRQQAAQSVVQESFSGVKKAIAAEDFWRGLDVGASERRTLQERLNGLLLERADEGITTPLLHPVADTERAQLQGWISQALYVVPEKTQDIGQRLRQWQEEQKTLEIDLRRAPEDEELAPLHAELLRLQTVVADVQRRRALLQEETGGVQYQRLQQEQQMEHAITQLVEAQTSEQEMVLAERSRSVLRAYEALLTRKRLAALEKALVESFNTLCQKEHLLTAASISPEDFTVSLESKDGRTLSLDSFSAGERQLYALALLQAMRQVSGHVLPLLIDTPLARLDAQHRQRLMQDYLPAVSDQVLLFATDAEIDADLMEQVEPQLAHAYRIHFDPDRRESHATEIMQLQVAFASTDNAEETARAV